MTFSGEYEWVKTTMTDVADLQEVAVEGGLETWDLNPLYVIRAWYNDNLIPGRLSFKHKKASISYHKKELVVEEFEILCAKPGILRWAPASYGNVPTGAISGGRTNNGEPLFVGRARYKHSITPGKVRPSHRCCYFAYYGVETWQRDYDVLCRKEYLG